LGHRASASFILPLGALLTATLGLMAPAQATLDEGGSPAASIRSVDAILYGPSLVDTFRHPKNIVADSARGIFLVADTGNQRLVTFDRRGRSRGSVQYDPQAQAGDRQIVEPTSLAFDRQGRIFLIDTMAADVEVLSPTGTHIGYLRPPLPADLEGQTRPAAITIGASGRIYLLCSGQRSGVLVLEADGGLVGQIGFPDPGTGTWQSPVAIAVDAGETEIAIVDPQAAREVAVYGTDGTLLAAFGEHGEGDGTFSMAVHAVWGPEGNLWVTDTIRHSISIFDRRGQYRGRIGGYGSGPGQFNYPAACAFLARDQVVVLERASARCQVITLDIEGLPSTQEEAASAEP
jgi:sugar lactone lactonase YvrE